MFRVLCTFRLPPVNGNPCIHWGYKLDRASCRPECCRADEGLVKNSNRLEPIGLERYLAGAPHSFSAQWVVQPGILAASKTILAESDLILLCRIHSSSLLR